MAVGLCLVVPVLQKISGKTKVVFFFVVLLLQFIVTTLEIPKKILCYNYNKNIMQNNNTKQDHPGHTLQTVDMIDCKLTGFKKKMQYNAWNIKKKKKKQSQNKFEFTLHLLLFITIKYVCVKRRPIIFNIIIIIIIIIVIHLYSAFSTRFKGAVYKN